MLLGAGRDLCRDHDQQEHDQQGRQPVLAAVGVEAIGVDRVARPDPPQRQEHQHEVQELLRRDVAVVRFAQDLAGVAAGRRRKSGRRTAPARSRAGAGRNISGPSRGHHRPSNPAMHCEVACPRAGAGSQPIGEGVPRVDNLEQAVRRSCRLRFHAWCESRRLHPASRKSSRSTSGDSSSFFPAGGAAAFGFHGANIDTCITMQVFA